MSNSELLLEHLLRAGVTPSFAFPLDVCQFEAEGLESWDTKKLASTSQDLRVALRGYSPGRILMIDNVLIDDKKQLFFLE